MYWAFSLRRISGKVKKKLVFFGLLMGWFQLLVAQTPAAWNLIQQKCTPCHDNSGIAPYNFANFREVYYNSKTIVYCLQKNIMPLWFANPKQRHFYNERVLSESEKQEIIQWVEKLNEKSFQKFNSSLAAAPVSIETNYPQPDRVISTSNTYHFSELSDQIFLNFQKNPGSVSTYLKGATIRYSDNSVVHHGVVYGIDSTNPVYQKLDTLSHFVQGNAFGDFTIGVYAPGVNYALLPDGFGYSVGAAKGLLFETHILGLNDSVELTSSAELFFCKEKVVREVKTINLANLDDKGPILPNTVKIYEGSYRINDSISILSLMPHMHKLAASFHSYAVTPNKDTIPLLDLEKWNFDWQTIYRLESMLVLPPKTIIHYRASFDNTTNNPENPSNPPEKVWVNQSWSTKNEMLIFGLQYVNYRAGDSGKELKWVTLQPQ